MTSELILNDLSAPYRRQAWTMTFAAMLGTMCCSTSVALINIGVFMKPLGVAFGWDRGAIAMALSIAAVAMAASNPFVGRAIDRYGVKPVLITSLVAYSAMLLFLPTMVGAWGLTGFYLAYALVAIFGAGSNVIAYVRLLCGWFDGPLNGRRGLALGISSAGVPLGAMVTAPAAVLLIKAFGWQGGFIGLAALPLLVGLPITIFLLKASPLPSTPAGAASALSAPSQPHMLGLSLKDAACTLPFWVMIAVVLLMAGALQGMSIHTAPLLSDLGISIHGLALVMGLTSGLAIVGRVTAGFLFDRFFAPRISVLIFAAAALSALAVVWAPILPVAVAAAFVLNFGSGAESDFIGYLVGRYFGLKNYGQIFGCIYGMFMVGVAVGPLLFGMGYDHFGSYRAPFMVAGLALVVLCLLLLLLPRFPVGGGHLKVKESAAKTSALEAKVV